MHTRSTTVTKKVRMIVVPGWLALHGTAWTLAVFAVMGLWIARDWVELKRMKDRKTASETELIAIAASKFKVDKDLLEAIRVHENGRPGYEFGVNRVPDEIQRAFPLEQQQYYAASLLVASFGLEYAQTRHPREFVRYLAEHYNRMDADHWDQEVWIEWNKKKRGTMSDESRTNER